jgi:hypothetical protein
MADNIIVHIGENSPEQVAYKLMERVMAIEGKQGTQLNRKYVLDTYAECLETVARSRTTDR